MNQYSCACITNVRDGGTKIYVDYRYDINNQVYKDVYTVFKYSKQNKTYKVGNCYLLKYVEKNPINNVINLDTLCEVNDRNELLRKIFLSPPPHLAK